MARRMRQSDKDFLYITTRYTGKLCKLINVTKMEKSGRDIPYECYMFSPGEIFFIVKVLRVASPYVEMIFLTRDGLYTAYTDGEIDDQTYSPREYMKKNFIVI
jgi:hypothetical protein